jgi:hypothetical protein
MGNVFENIAARRDERVKDLHLDLPVPTWDRDLIARFAILPRKEVEQFANKRRNLEADMDFIIKATHEIYVFDPEHNAEEDAKRMDENDDYVRVEDETGRPLGFEQLFGEKIGMKPEEGQETIRARKVVMYCFKDNSIAIGGFTVKVINWMQNTDAEVADSLVGE